MAEQYPHCDSNVLHAPEDGCKFCNTHDDWQRQRVFAGTCFTGHNPDWMNEHYGFKDWYPCPAERIRPVETINRWGGNIPYTAEVERQQKQYWDAFSNQFAKGFNHVPRYEHIDHRPPWWTRLVAKIRDICSID